MPSPLPYSGLFGSAATQGSVPAWMQQASFAPPPAPANYVEQKSPMLLSSNQYLDAIGGPGFAAIVGPVIADQAAQHQQKLAASAAPAPTAIVQPPAAVSGAADSKENNIVVGSGSQANPMFGETFNLRGLR